VTLVLFPLRLIFAGFMGKHRKKSKRQRSEASVDGPCHDPATESVPLALSTEQNHGSLERKRKRKEDEHTFPPESLTQDSQAKKRKKNKPKKKKNTRAKEIVLSERCHSDDVDEPSPLEGSMVSGQMVLIDRSKGIVFAATDREGNGARKQVGIVKDGKMQLTVNATPGKLPLTPNYCSLFIACIEAGLGLFSMVFRRSNIVLECGYIWMG
jgi:hypothetical protein